MTDRREDEVAAIPYRPTAEPSATGVAGVRRRHEQELLEIRGVEGVGVGERGGREVILAYVHDATVQERLPREIEGVPVAAEVTGEISAL